MVKSADRHLSWPFKAGGVLEWEVWDSTLEFDLHLCWHCTRVGLYLRWHPAELTFHLKSLELALDLSWHCTWIISIWPQVSRRKRRSQPTRWLHNLLHLSCGLSGSLVFFLIISSSSLVLKRWVLCSWRKWTRVSKSKKGQLGTWSKFKDWGIGILEISDINKTGHFVRK
jgi:hypothetical protein